MTIVELMVQVSETMQQAALGNQELDTVCFRRRTWPQDLYGHATSDGTLRLRMRGSKVIDQRMSLDRIDLLATDWEIPFVVCSWDLP